MTVVEPYHPKRKAPKWFDWLVLLLALAGILGWGKMYVDGKKAEECGGITKQELNDWADSVRNSWDSIHSVNDSTDGKDKK